MSAPIRNKRTLVGGATSPRLKNVALCAADIDESDGPTRLKPRNVTAAPEVADYLEEIVAQAPPMTAHARAKLATLLGHRAQRGAA
ncbi:hypothetical protein [Nocardia ignorata]|uniref:Uncharacterized protein n=1 Tax=Nocardia ignorata TaxID=145285 RepID=A0A4R6PL99_NOCIG|nr:hypothetical protein [Nocardia ignorata]TDP38745.1 hypothetical protein DFR75_103402 [Nocardia ignorata]